MAAVLCVACSGSSAGDAERDASVGRDAVDAVDAGADGPPIDMFASVDASDVPAPERFPVLAVGTIAAYQGIVWTWSHHHYVQRNGLVALSEVWHPWILPGRSGCLYGTDSTDNVYVGPPGTVVAGGMIPWAGRADRAVLLDDTDRVRRFTDGVLEPGAIALPRQPRRPEISPDDRAPALAALVGDQVVWASVDGAVMVTDLTSGASTTLATEGVDVVAGHGDWAAFRDADTLWIADVRRGGLTTFALEGDELGAPDALAVGGDGVFVGGDRQVVHRAFTGEVLRTIRLSDGTVHALAADDTRVYVLIDGEPRRVEAHD